MFAGTDLRCSFTEPIFLDGSSWPKRLEPRTSVSVYCVTPEPPPGSMIECAYAMTQCGEVIKGSSKALEQIAMNTAKK
jgi:hypothetical protein